ncbi:MAG: zinc-binding alcohol dehydrogenase family protein [Saprospiraceae bacterium]|nr:zinc-binding alcohol dehydrogenase family protein [Saprospiraceae bacterium]
MKYLVCLKPGEIRVKEKEEPSFREDQVLVQIKNIGICGTDLHAFAGDQMFFQYPRVLGHELSGEVIEKGEAVDHLETGDRVVIVPFNHCGVCVACKAGKTNCCSDLKVLGVHVDGGMQEKLAVQADLVLAVNDLGYDEIAIIEPLSIGAHAIRRSRLQAGEFAVVVGAGPIGLGIMRQALLKKAVVIAVDVVPERLDYAKNVVGVDYAVDADEDATMKIAEITRGDLATVVFDASGNKQALETGHKYMAHGGRYVIVGLHNGDLSFHHPSVQAKETSLLFSRNATFEDFQEVIKILRNNQFDSASFITHRVPFQDLTDYFQMWQNPASGVIKAMIQI